jgi:branched-chain amino acid transport system substrate-binding protein
MLRPTSFLRQLGLALLLLGFLLSIGLNGGGRPALAVVPGSESSKSGHEPSAKDTLARAKALIDARRDDEAIALLKNVLATSNDPPSLTHAYLLMAAALSDKQEYAQALEYLERLLAEFPDSALTGRARLLMGTLQAQLGNPDAALSALSEARTLSSDPDTKLDALIQIGDVYVQKKEPLRAIQTWLEALGSASGERQTEVRERIRVLVQDKLDKKTLGQLRDAYPSAFPGDLALIRLIELHLNRGEDHMAEKNLRLFVIHFPTHAYAPTAGEQLRTLKSKVKASQYVIAAVLPTSGRMSQFATECLNGIRLALDKGREALGLTSVGLMVKDSNLSDKGQLRAEWIDLLAEYRPLAVIGPLLSRDLPLAAEVAENAEVPFITPSATVPDVRRLGTYVFSTALTYPQQARRLADYAVGRLGYRRFCILHSEAGYGQELARLFSQEVRQRGGEIIAIESFGERDTDFGLQLKRLKAEDLKHYGTTTETETTKGTKLLVYTPGFDAIFVPANYTQAALIAPQLLFHDIKVPILGSNGWNSPDLLRLGDRSLEGSVFVDAIFQGSPDPDVRDFVDRYKRRFQSNPTLFAAQAYDATRAVLEALRKGGSSAKAVRDHLLNNQVPSLGGPASFGPSGTLERRVFLIQVKHGKFMQVE